MEQKDIIEGPTIREIPSQRQQVCGDCKYHQRDRWFCGSDYVTDNYSCLHPDFADEKRYSFAFGNGREIAFNSRETPSTPSWCPFLKQQS
jgi:hypothetical protein